jgi:predicted Abi (CAAX) family protease
MLLERIQSVSSDGWTGDACVVDPEQAAGIASQFYEEILSTKEAEIERLKARLNTPELHDFTKAVVLEAAHQRERWGEEHDAGKTNEDWFWLIGYLAGKVLSSAKSGDDHKALHHTISTAAALANWHAALNDDNHEMRPGIGEGK